MADDEANNGDDFGGSAFLPLPIPRGNLLRVLGPPPALAATTVDPLTRVDEPVTIVGSCRAGICDEHGRLVQPLEILLTLDLATVVPDKQIPMAAVGERFRALPGLLERLAETPGFEVFHRALESSAPGGMDRAQGPLLFCRKRRCIFAARSPRTAELLAPAPETHVADAKGADSEPLPAALLSWDGGTSSDESSEVKTEKAEHFQDGPEAHAPLDLESPLDSGSPLHSGSNEANVYGGRGGSCKLGIIKSLDELVMDQGRVVALADAMRANDAEAAAQLVAQHACVACPERERCYPRDDGYAYAADRLTPISAAAAPVVLRPYGAWGFDEATRAMGGLALGDALNRGDESSNEYEAWRAEQAREFDTGGPPRLLAGETDGRELIEVARLKLNLIADLLAQLDAIWRETRRPHLCWNAETVRVAWQRPGATPASCWGFHPIPRKIGLQPLSPAETRDGRPLPYPPAFSESAYLPPKAVEAARYFNEPRAVTLFIKRAQPDGAELIVNVLLEDLNIAWDLFTTGDAVHVSGDGWRAVLSPAGQRDPDDGEGLPFSGRMRGKVDGFRKSDTFERIECRWRPRFGEAVDLHAVGMLLFEGLLAHDERSLQSFREQLATETSELTTTCLSLPPEQRESQVRAWLTERCETDAPAAIWTRRNLFYRREDRNRARLDAFAPALWQEIMTAGLRMTTCIPGFSYCLDHACDAPRVGSGFLLPLVELRGLIALLDDQIFGRTAPAAGVREAVRK